MLKPIKNHAQTTYHVQTMLKPSSNQSKTMLIPIKNHAQTTYFVQTMLKPSSNQSKTMLKPYTMFKPCSNLAQTNPPCSSVCRSVGNDNKDKVDPILDRVLMMKVLSAI